MPSALRTNKDKSFNSLSIQSAGNVNVSVLIASTTLMHDEDLRINVDGGNKAENAVDTSNTAVN